MDELAVEVEQRAFYKGRDVSDVVRAAGLPINVVNQAGFHRLEKLTPAQREIMQPVLPRSRPKD